MTIRIPEDQADNLANIAKVDGTSVNACILDAIAVFVQLRVADPDFQARLAAHQQQSSEAYDRLQRPS